MATSISTLKSWFTTGKFPTQAQFWAWLDSFRHKDESIPVNEIDGLSQLLGLKADVEFVSNHINDIDAHAALIQVASFTALPQVGKAEKIYVTIDFNKQYRWNGTAYIEVSKPALLKGSQYTYVYGNGTPIENATELKNAYTAAKAISGLSSTNRFKIIVGTGMYEFVGQFAIDTQFIDFISLSGDADVHFTNGIYVSANDVFLKGLKTSSQFRLATNLSLLFCDTCVGLANYSFGQSTSTVVSGTFTNCVAGSYSFGGNSGGASGTFTNCISNNYSFGGTSGGASGTFTNCKATGYSFGNLGGASGTFTNCISGHESFGYSGGASGTFTNCRAESYSFGYSGGSTGTFTNCIASSYSFDTYGVASGTFTNCIGGTLSFGGNTGGSITGKLYYCRLTSGTFKTVLSGGRTYYCIDGNGNTNNQ